MKLNQQTKALENMTTAIEWLTEDIIMYRYDQFSQAMPKNFVLAWMSCLLFDSVQD